jgi:hypothetical protein
VMPTRARTPIVMNAPSPVVYSFLADNSKHPQTG